MNHRKYLESLISPNISMNTEDEKENKCPDSGCIQKKDNGKWGVVSGKTGKFWSANYETQKDAEAGLKAYFVNK